MIYYRTENGERRYTLEPEGAEAAVPAKYSVEDKFSAERIELKKRHGIFPFTD
ncbi:H/ACA ribonucleoprotein complex subunit 3 [Pancytospora philotis]|nr:H/ACA ribonucleoprotein complex subunit 3 [Pancytospora philotis]